MGFNKKEYARQRYLDNKAEIQERSRKWNYENKERAKEKYLENYDKNREANIARATKWNKENRERFNENQRNNRDKILNSIRVRINRCLKDKKNGRAISYLGCNIQEYIVYLERQFDDKMNWANYGIYWEIDHIKPLSKGGSFNYMNTQPLSITENRKKSNKWENN